MIGEMITKIVEKKNGIGGIQSVAFVACGGSFSTLYPAKYFLDSESKKLRAGHYTANEFVHATPSYIGKNSVVVTISHKGNTPETVEAAKKAQELGAASIALTFEQDSPLSKYGDFVLPYEWGPDADQKNSNVVTVMRIAAEILHQVEGYAHYDEFCQACGKLNAVTGKAKAATAENAKAFARDYKDEKIIYTMGSGTGMSAAYSYAICILMEMQWINSSAIHSGEYFHGPFEITEPDVPFILLKSSGRTRPLDLRALKFLEKYGKKFITLDAQELGLPEIGKNVCEFFDHIFLTVILRQYAEELASIRNHPLSERRYMWKVEY
ncbi:SIS domain-containing protein [Breznakiella homolactica]|uniref:SIS domain-containing protein n=1 Tax=Breznakiella homolactica TaxID=2798577 RepID=A0A7T7XQT2_9SPIR|nr:SIS domain-containing protein [Breznakiella homolactica]QQO10778.1 SIS domain-containing protein [Breznakiella homolactica]